MAGLNKRIGALLMVAAIGAAAAGFAWQRLRQPALPDAFAVGNGRLEATEFDIATKLPGRLAEVLVDEGDTVRAGQALARLSGEDLDAALREAEAQLQQAIENEKHLRAQVKQRESEHRLAGKTLQRTRAVLAKGLIAAEAADRHETQLQSAAAALEAARVGVTGAGAAIAAARARVERVAADRNESVLLAPIDGRVLYRLAEPGEVLAAGGKVLTVIDLGNAYMPIFLPADQAGRVRLGAQARIVFDALSDTAVPATVSFVAPRAQLAPRAQFTPKEVETRSEREKLMFRIKVQIDRALLEQYGDLVKPGVPGVAYVQLDPQAPWPAWLPQPVAPPGALAGVE
jgi:HlyD family secretion protein